MYFPRGESNGEKGDEMETGFTGFMDCTQGPVSLKQGLGGLGGL